MVDPRYGASRLVPDVVRRRAAGRIRLTRQQRRMLLALRAHGEVSADFLAYALHISPRMARRYLRILEAERVAFRSAGGEVTPTGSNPTLWMSL